MENQNNSEDKVKKKNNTLRLLVYAGLAGGLVSVACVSQAAHGNASSHQLASIGWDADDVDDSGGGSSSNNSTEESSSSESE